MSPESGRRGALEAFYRAALAAVEPEAAVAGAVRAGDDGVRLGDLDLPAGTRVGAVTVGKAAAPMARACEKALGPVLTFGVAITKDGHGLPLERFVLRESAHPVPDARCEAAGREALRVCRASPGPEVLLLLLSGGASALWTCPLPGLALGDVADLTGALLRGGADIDELNCVRKHLCELAGGRLARDAAAARCVGLLISDVPGDRLEVIASGPLTPDPSTYAEALDVVDRRASAAEVPEALLAHLRAGVRGERPESPKPGAFPPGRVHQRILAGNATAVAAAATAGREAGYRVVVAEGALSGEAREVAQRILAAARALGGPEPALLVAGGETTVHVRGDGRGGRSQELALAAALALDGAQGISLLAAGTDGTDGPTDAAGAFADGGSVARGRARGLDAAHALEHNDSYGFFAGEGGLLRTGPTRTNVMDLALIAVHPAAD